MAAYRAALEERTRERVPLDWASTQNNLGNALDGLGERESGTTRLEAAVAAWDDCLQVATSNWPPEWVQYVSARRDEARAESRVGRRDSGSPLTGWMGSAAFPAACAPGDGGDRAGASDSRLDCSSAG